MAKLCRHCRMPWPSECICDDTPAVLPEPDTDAMAPDGGDRGWNEP